MPGDERGDGRRDEVSGEKTSYGFINREGGKTACLVGRVVLGVHVLDAYVSGSES